MLNDLLSVITVCLGRDEKASGGNELHRLLTAILSEKLTVQEKKDILEQEYGFAMNREVDGRMTGMCNLSELIEERALERGRAEGIVESSIEFGLPKNEILERLQRKLNIPLNTAQEYFELYGKSV